MNLPLIMTPWGVAHWTVFEVEVPSDKDQHFFVLITEYWLTLKIVPEKFKRVHAMALIEGNPEFPFRGKVWAGEHGTDSGAFPRNFAYYADEESALNGILSMLRSHNGFSPIEQLALEEQMFMPLEESEPPGKLQGES